MPGGYSGGWWNPGNWLRGLYTGDANAPDVIYDAASEAAGGSYVQNAKAVHQALEFTTPPTPAGTVLGGGTSLGSRAMEAEFTARRSRTGNFRRLEGEITAMAAAPGAVPANQPAVASRQRGETLSRRSARLRGRPLRLRGRSRAAGVTVTAETTVRTQMAAGKKPHRRTANTEYISS